MSEDDQLKLIPDEPGEPHNDPARWGPRLLRLLDEQRDACRRLLALSEQQAEAVAAGDLERLAGVIAARQPLVDATQLAAAAIEPFVRSLGGFGGLIATVPVGLRQGIESRLKELEDLLGAIGERDDADARSLTARREAMGREMAGLEEGRVAMNAYGRTESGDDAGPRFQDREV